jgi:hypothetical protein
MTHDDVIGTKTNVYTHKMTKEWAMMYANTLCSITENITVLPPSPSWGIASLRQTIRTLPQDTSPRERVENSCWTSRAWWHRLHNKSVDLWQCVIFRSEVGSHQRAGCRWKTLAAFVYLERSGNQRLWLASCTRGSSRWFRQCLRRYLVERSLRPTETVGYSAWCSPYLSQNTRVVPSSDMLQSNNTRRRATGK